MFQLFNLLLQTLVIAAPIHVNEADLLKVTGLEKSYVMRETENSLESYLYYDNNGISCGLEEFYVEGYTITEGTESAPTKFEVITTVSGPVNYCAQYSQFQCYTYFYLKNSTWNTLGAECEHGTEYNE